MKALFYIIFIAFFFGFAIGIHEFGHLLASLWQNLHVDKFSIGFGKRICGFKWHNIDFELRCLPFGGFVSIPQLEPDDHPKAEDGKELPPASPKARAIAAAAGPLFNILFGLVLGTLLWCIGVWDAAPSHSVIIQTVPQVLPLYQDGLTLTDKIISVDGQRVAPNSSWELLCDEMTEVPASLELQIQRDGQLQSLTYTPVPNPEWTAGLRPGDRVTKINGKKFSQGVKDFTQEYLLSKTGDVVLELTDGFGQTKELQWHPAKNPLMENLGAPFFFCTNPVCVNDILPDSAAALAQIQAGDQLLAVNGETITSREDLQKKLADTDTDAKIVFRLGRGDQEFDCAPLTFPADTTRGDQTPKSLGLVFYSLEVNTLIEGMPAAKAGLQQGDKLLTVNGQEILSPESFTQIIRACDGKPVDLQYSRNGENFQIALQPEKKEVDGKEIYQIGVVIGYPSSKILTHPTPWKQFTDVVAMTGRSLSLLFQPITNRVKSTISGEPVTNHTQVGVRHMSGPLGIIMALWYKMQAEGVRGGFSFIVLITFSLALVNLIPLPVLDGGHVALAFIETIIRRHLPIKLVRAVQTVFAVLLIALMLYITAFDGNRLFQRVKLWFNQDIIEEQSQMEPVPEPESEPTPAPASQDTDAPSSPAE